MKKFFESFSKEHNIIIGVTDALPLYNIKSMIDKKTPFVNKDLEKRLNPKALWEESQSIIVIAVPYGVNYKFNMDSELRGRIAMGFEGLDYHISVKDTLNKLMCELNKIYQINFKIFIDSGYLPEKELAKKSGIGFQGKNCCIITEKFGSFVFLGIALVDKILEPTKGFLPWDNFCGDCDLCEKACPTGAIKNFTCHTDKCISFINQNKADIPEELGSKMTTFLYGCDICQRVCPFNKGKYVKEITDINIPMPKLDEFIEMSNMEFKEKYKNTAILWKGRKTLLRNAEILKARKGGS